MEALQETEAFRALGEIESISLYNEEAKVHKLSHQHLYTKFYIIGIASKPKIVSKYEICSVNQIHEYPVPILIGKFVEVFFKNDAFLLHLL